MDKISLKYRLLMLCLISVLTTYAQLGGHGGGLKSIAQQPATDADKNKPVEYEIGGIRVQGNHYLDADLIEAVTNLAVMQKVHLPNDENIAKAIRNLWKQELFSDVNILIEKYIDIFKRQGRESRRCADQAIGAQRVKAVRFRRIHADHSGSAGALR